MKGKGITIRRLLATGATVEAAGVTFSLGLNIVAYMSQTGKSYILECIDFMLGGKTPPRSIKQSKGYDTLWLEITENSGDTYVLRRLLDGGPFRLYRMPLADITENSPYSALAATKRAKSSAASFIMRLSGFPSAKLKRNEANAKSSLSLRTISHFFIVDEISMIEDRSPIQTRAGYAITTERSAFKFLLTGQDDSNLEEIESVSPEELAESIRREVYDELIEQVAAELAQLRSNDLARTDRLADLERLLEATSVDIADTTATIKQQQTARKDAWLVALEAESRMLVLGELFSRFTLLRSHYESDLQRLQFISEGQHYLGQLETIACPLCGTTLAEQPPGPGGDGGDLSVAGVQNAYARESDKIRSHMQDLEGTVAVLRAEESEVNGKATALQNRVRDIDRVLSNELAPRMTAARAQVQELIEEKSRLLNLQTLEARLATLREVRASLGEPTVEGGGEAKDDAASGIHIDDQAVRDFCEVMRGLLERWHFLPPKATVTFDTAKFDFAVDGQARRDNGKGVRAIIHAAFNVALMRYCLEKNLPHPRFVVLDSPLTTFKEPRQNARPEDIDEVPGEVQTAFFEDLAAIKPDDQIIVLENKQPPPSIKERSTYTQFVGYEIPGREGFFPVFKVP